MPDSRVPLKAWAFRGLGLILVQTDAGLEGEIWDGADLQVVMKLGSTTEATAIARLQHRAGALRSPSRLDPQPSGRQRNFIDAGGRPWLVSERVSARWNWGQEAVGLRDRALFFEAENEHCRLTNYPANWDMLSDDELEAMLGRAECTWRRRASQ